MAENGSGNWRGLPYYYHWDTNPETGERVIVDNASGKNVKPTKTFDPSGWGGQGTDALPEGRVEGTSGANVDTNRYRQMAGQQTAAPSINYNQLNESRPYSTDAIGLLAQSADGSDPSAAMMLGQQTTQNAINNQQSLANSVRGGAGARAAAARAAQFNQASIATTGQQQAEATRAGEMATARTGLMDAANKQRGLDSAAEIEQAKLQAQQRQQDAQHNQYYERLGWETNNAQLGAKLGRSAAEQAAANAAKATQLSEDQQSWANTKDAASTTLGGISGGLSAYQKTSQSDPTAKEPPTAGSDERMKTNVMSLGQRLSTPARGGSLDASVPLMDPDENHILQQGDDGHAYYADVARPDDGSASLAGPAPLLGARARNNAIPAPPPRAEAPAPKAKAKAAAPKKVKSLDDQIAEMEAEMRSDHMARMAQGPAVSPYALSDEKTKDDGGMAAMEDANRSLMPSIYEYKPGFTPPTQEPGEKNVGPMANAMAQSPIARTAIVQDPNTGLLAINKEKGLKLALGGIASLQGQVDALKRKKAS